MKLPWLARTLGVVLLFTVLVAADPVAAHEGVGVVVVESRQPTGPYVRYVVRLTWSADGHAANQAALSATPVSPSGVAGTPVTMWPYDYDGRYVGTLTMAEPGAWTIVFSSANPPTSVAVVETVGVAAI